MSAQFKTLPLEFTLGDARNYGDFHNRPLLNGQEYVFFVLALLDLSENVSGSSAGAGEQVVGQAMNTTPPPPPDHVLHQPLFGARHLLIRGSPAHCGRGGGSAVGGRAGAGCGLHRLHRHRHPPLQEVREVGQESWIGNNVDWE